ncbi:MAG: hypothetical protein ACJ8F7_09405 [Gemmataceae bacterium]
MQPNDGSATNAGPAIDGTGFPIELEVLVPQVEPRVEERDGGVRRRIEAVHRLGFEKVARPARQREILIIV